MARAPIIQLKNVVKKFFLGNDELTILKGITLDIYAGEYVIFFGSSGSGKSTILNTICGLEPPTSGEVVIRGENITKYNSGQLAKFRRSKIGIVFQQFNLVKSFKVWENVAFPLTNDGVPLRRRRERSIMLLDLLGLGKMVGRVPTELSGGQQQRVAIARALAANAWIIIADEPTGNLDSRSAKDVMDIFHILNTKSHRTVIMVTHNPDYLKEADRVFFIKDGLIDKEVKNHKASETKEEVGDVSSLKDFVFHDEKPKEEKKPKESSDGKIDKDKEGKQNDNN